LPFQGVKKKSERGDKKGGCGGRELAARKKQKWLGDIFDRQYKAKRSHKKRRGQAKVMGGEEGGERGGW